MQPLTKKLVRDLWHMRGQVLAVCAVTLCGIATLLSMQSVLASLKQTTTQYYHQYAFADLFTNVRQAPASVRSQLIALPQVKSVEARIVMDVTLDVPGLTEAVSGRLISLPDVGEPALNKVFIREGRVPETERADEVLVSEAFLTANNLRMGEKIGAILNGRWQQLTVVGSALSPEYVYEVPPSGSMFPENKHFGVLWIPRKTLANAFGLTESYNDFTFSLYPSALNTAGLVATRAAIDRILRPYGSIGSYDRKEQVSARFLADEMRQYVGTSLVIPFIFLAVTSFLLNIVISRLVTTEREQIAVLKAFGYSNTRIAHHYLSFALLGILPGLVSGIAVGYWVGDILIGVYKEYFRFPHILFVVPGYAVAGSCLLTVAAALLGAIRAVRNAVLLPPAEAMQAPAPPAYRRGILEMAGLSRYLSTTARIIVRDLERRPVRVLASVVTVCFALGLLMIGRFAMDGVTYLLDSEFHYAQHQDITVSFRDPRPQRVLYELGRIPGVLAVEGERYLAVRIMHNGHERRVPLEARIPGSQLRRVVDKTLALYDPPRQGIAITKWLADVLHVRRGESVWIEIQGGKYPPREVTVVETIDQLMGMTVYADLQWLRTITGEDQAYSQVLLRIDPLYNQSVVATLKHIPAASGIVARQDVIRSYNKLLAQNLGASTITLTLFASVLAFGVVYNSGRISLSERARELMSLRVLGFTRREVATILFGQQAITVLISLPIGLVAGYLMCLVLPSTMNNDIYRMPIIFTKQTIGFSLLIILLSSLLSSLLILRRLHALSLIEVLKTRE